MKQFVKSIGIGLFAMMLLALPVIAQERPVSGDSGWEIKLNNHLGVSLNDTTGKMKNSVISTNNINLTNVTLSKFTNDANYLVTVGNVNLNANTIKAEKLNLTDVTLSDFSNDRNDLFSIGNFTGNYDSRADRFLIENYTTLENAAFRIINFTAQLNNFLPSFFNIGNFTLAYDSKVDRFANENFTARYDLRTDRFGNINFTNLLPPYPTNSTIQIGTSQVTNLAGFVIANEQNPKNATILIGTSQVSGLADFIAANERNPTNGTLQIGTSQVTGLADFVVANEKNPSNSTIVIPRTQVTGLTVGNLADDNSGWIPDGATVSFTITASASSVGANSVILVSLGANADTAAVCSVTTRTASTNFVVGCATSPDNAATLQYIIIN